MNHAYAEIFRALMEDYKKQISEGSITDYGKFLTAEEIEQLPIRKERIKNRRYIKKGKVCIWDGKVLKCEHNRLRSICKECSGNSICKHGNRNLSCKKCGGPAFCIHGKLKQYCKTCDGSAFCKHRKLKQYCKDCGGSALCKHGKRKVRCKDCGGSALCRSVGCERFCNKNNKGYCLFCYTCLHPDEKVNKRYRNSKETKCITFLTESLCSKNDKNGEKEGNLKRK